MLAQYAGQHVMGVDMQFGITLSGAHLGDKALLRGVDAVDQRLEFRRLRRGVGARDVAGVAGRTGTGIDQERAAVRRRRAVEIRVVQHRAMFVEADDAGIGQFGIDLPRRGEVGHVDAELAFAGAERGFGGAVRPRPDPAGFTHQHQFVRCLVTAVPVQIVEHGWRIVRFDAVDGGTGGGDHGALAGGQRAQRVGGVAHDHDVEVLDPVAVRRFRHHMPVVVGLQENQLRLVARRIGDPAARCVGQRQPVLEMRTHHKRIVLVIQKLAQRRARGDQQMIEAGQRECLVDALTHGGQMLRIQRGELIVHERLLRAMGGSCCRIAAGLTAGRRAASCSCVQGRNSP